MIDTPDLDTSVFIRVLREGVVKGRGTEEDTIWEGKLDDVLILRWSSAKPLVEKGDAELI